MPVFGRIGKLTTFIKTGVLDWRGNSRLFPQPQVRKKVRDLVFKTRSGNFTFCQGNLKFLLKVRGLLLLGQHKLSIWFMFWMWRHMSLNILNHLLTVICSNWQGQGNLAVAVLVREKIRELIYGAPFWGGSSCQSLWSFSFITISYFSSNSSYT